jgi:hypothetical protein
MLRARVSSRGYSVLELLLAVAISATVAGLSVPMTRTTIDSVRTAMAARHVEGRIMDARMQAIRRSARVGFRFDRAAGDSRMGEFLDGNGNGLRTAEIAAGIDSVLSPPQALGDHFPGVRYCMLPGVPEVDGGAPPADGDGIRVGGGRILTLGPDGTSSSGTLYVCGRRAQFAVRVFGATARTRMMRFDPATRRWETR